MAGNTSAISLASNALVLLGHPPISDFNEPGAGAQAASNLYDSCYENLLSMNRWRFASKKVELSKLSAAPDNEFTYQYQLPSDFIYLIKTQVEQDFEIYGDKLYSNHPSVSIDYTYKVDEAMLPPYFVKTFQYLFASELAIPVVGNSTREQEYSAKFQRQYQMAVYLDASQRPVDISRTSSYIGVRNG